MEKIAVFIIFAVLTFSSCHSTRKSETAQQLTSILPQNSSRHNGSFIGEALDKNNKINVVKITLSSDTNGYTLDSSKGQQSGLYSWVNESGNIIELNGLAENYPNKFLVTPGAIIQMMNGSTLQDINGINQFVLALQ